MKNYRAQTPQNLVLTKILQKSGQRARNRPFCGATKSLLWASSASGVYPGFPSLACLVTCIQWIPQIHFWCDTC